MPRSWSASRIDGHIDLAPWGIGHQPRYGANPVHAEQVASPLRWQAVGMGLLATVVARDVHVELREATAQDVPGLIALLADDHFGERRDGLRTPQDLEPYLRAFRAIDQDPQHLLVAAHTAAELVGTLQLSFLPGLARRGTWRAQIEAVRVAGTLRGSGLGSAMVRWSIDEARRRGCSLVQLTTDKRRPDAHRFYQRLGFTSSHEGMKLRI
jgi:GNAT superfamily N-acetyltransferase